MANPEHLQIVKQGVEVWNQWRKQHSDITPDLTRANLSGAKLSRANLSEANLSGTVLRRANLREVNLRQANLGQVDLFEANLTRAFLGDVNLVGALLILTNFVKTNMSGADLSKVSFSETIFGDTNLTAVWGLETCRHIGPSTLDHRTLARSGPLPLAFLRGCSLNDWEIEVTKYHSIN